MSGHGRAVSAALLAGLVLATLLLPHGSADAQAAPTISEIGWWSRRPAAGAQPAGGFEVASGLQGEESVAALRVTVDGTVSTATLTLTESGGLNQAASLAKICKTTASWTAANPGAYDARPAADCAAEVPVARDAASSTWTADVTTLLAAGGSVSLMVIPVAEPTEGLPVSQPFQVAFSGAAVTAEVATTDTTTATVAPFDAGPTFDSGGFDDAVVPSVPYDAGVIDLPSPSAPTAVIGPTAEAAPLDQAAQSSDLPTAATTGGGGGGDQPWWRLAVLIPIAVGIGYGSMVVRRVLEQRSTAVAGA